jgi:hypothetical protein
MIEEEKLRWDIATVRESIRLDWADLASKNLSADQRKAIREHLGMCNSALKDFRNRLDTLSARSHRGSEKPSSAEVKNPALGGAPPF